MHHQVAIYCPSTMTRAALIRCAGMEMQHHVPEYKIPLCSPSDASEAQAVLQARVDKAKASHAKAQAEKASRSDQIKANESTPLEVVKVTPEKEDADGVVSFNGDGESVVVVEPTVEEAPARSEKSGGWARETPSQPGCLLVGSRSRGRVVPE